MLNVWKRVESYARDGFTAIIHGKYWHEETRATASQVMKYPEGRYLVLLNMDEAKLVMDFVEQGGDPAPLAERFGKAASPGFDWTRHLERVGFANQTTMLAGRVAGDRGRVPRCGGPAPRRRGGRAAGPLVRHHLLGHPGAAGRGAQAPGGTRST